MITHVLATLAAHERAHGLYSEFIDIEPEPEAETDAADGEDGKDGAEEMVTVMRTEQAEYYDEHGELQVEEVTYEELVPASSLLEDTFVEKMTEFERTKRPVSLCLRLVNKLMSFLPDVNRHWRNYDHYFAVVANFSAVGPLERTYMLERHTYAVCVWWSLLVGGLFSACLLFVWGLLWLWSWCAVVVEGGCDSGHQSATYIPLPRPSFPLHDG